MEKYEAAYGMTMINLRRTQKLQILKYIQFIETSQKEDREARIAKKLLQVKEDEDLVVKKEPEALTGNTKPMSIEEVEHSVTSIRNKVNKIDEMSTV